MWKKKQISETAVCNIISMHITTYIYKLCQQKEKKTHLLQKVSISFLRKLSDFSLLIFHVPEVHWLQCKAFRPTGRSFHSGESPTAFTQANCKQVFTVTLFLCSLFDSTVTKIKNPSLSEPSTFIYSSEILPKQATGYPKTFILLPIANLVSSSDQVYHDLVPSTE